MQISLGDDNRIYIARCPIVGNKAVIHEEYDMDNSLDNTRLLDKSLTEKYIADLCYNDITFICLNKANEEITILYNAI